jgi:tetratricopeptide (TPR) repeat protein
MDLQGHDDRKEGPDRTAEKIGQGEKAPSGGRDYLPLGVLIFLLVALMVTGYFSFKAMAKGYDFRAELSMKEWIQGLEEKARDLLGQRTRIIEGKRDSAKEHLLEGYRLYRKKRYARALDELDKAIQMNETNPEAYFWRGRTLISQGRFESAAEDFQKVLKLKPDYAEAYDNLGWLYDRLGETDRAIDALSKSIELKSDNGWTYYQRGRVRFKKGDREGALRDAEKACSLGFEEGCKAYENFKSEG